MSCKASVLEFEPETQEEKDALASLFKKHTPPPEPALPLSAQINTADADMLPTLRRILALMYNDSDSALSRVGEQNFDAARTLAKIVRTEEVTKKSDKKKVRFEQEQGEEIKPVGEKPKKKHSKHREVVEKQNDAKEEGEAARLGTLETVEQASGQAEQKALPAEQLELKTETDQKQKMETAMSPASIPEVIAQVVTAEKPANEQSAEQPNQITSLVSDQKNTERSELLKQDEHETQCAMLNTMTTEIAESGTPFAENQIGENQDALLADQPTHEASNIWPPHQQMHASSYLAQDFHEELEQNEHGFSIQPTVELLDGTSRLVEEHTVPEATLSPSVNTSKVQHQQAEVSKLNERIRELEQQNQAILEEAFGAKGRSPLIQRIIKQQMQPEIEKTQEVVEELSDQQKRALGVESGFTVVNIPRRGAVLSAKQSLDKFQEKNEARLPPKTYSLRLKKEGAMVVGVIGSESVFRCEINRTNIVFHDESKMIEFGGKRVRLGKRYPEQKAQVEELIRRCEKHQ